MMETVKFLQRPLRYLIILGLLLSFLLPQQRAYACSCVPPGPPEMALQEATAVFSGKVTDRQIGQRLHFAFRYPFIHLYQAGAKFTFAVSEIWKGAPYETIIINTGTGGGDCGLGLRTGEEYLIYAYGEQNALGSNICTRTRPLANASEDIAILGTGDPPTIAGANESSSFGWLIGSCTAVLFVIIASFLLLKRRRHRSNPPIT